MGKQQQYDDDDDGMALTNERSLFKQTCPKFNFQERHRDFDVVLCVFQLNTFPAKTKRVAL